MKKLIFTTLLAVSTVVYAQYAMPSASPRQVVEQQFSISKISVDYGRPGVKGRKVFGELVPYGKVWRAGANANTKITFGQAVVFGDKVLPAGKYGLYIVPFENEWKVMLNSDSISWGTVFDEKKNVLEFTTPVLKLADKQEWFDIAIEPVDENTVNLTFKWDSVKAIVPVKVAQQEATSKIVEHLREIRQIEREANKKN